MRLSVRDVAFQKLRDVTVAIAVVAAASVGVIAWVSAATIPGTTTSSEVSGNVATGVDDQPSTGGGGFVQAPTGRRQPGPGVAVSGGSR
jgi:hypothetical protein